MHSHYFFPPGTGRGIFGARILGGVTEGFGLGIFGARLRDLGTPDTPPACTLLAISPVPVSLEVGDIATILVRGSATIIEDTYRMFHDGSLLTALDSS